MNNIGELSVRFQMRLSSLPAVVQPGLRFVLHVDNFGYLRINAFVESAEFELESIDSVAIGEWHQIAFKYSRFEKRAAFYLDKRLQVEVCDVSLPDFLKICPLVDENNSEVREYTEYPYSVSDEELFLADAADIIEWESKAKLAAENVANNEKKQLAAEHVGYFKYFMSETEKSGYGTFPLMRLKEEVAFIENCANCSIRQPTAKFRLMCYNIRSGVGAETWNNQFKLGELRGLPRVARAIRDAGADYVCMQEVDKLAERTGCVDQTEYLAGETGLIPYFQNKAQMGEGFYGLAQLSRTEAKSFKMLKLPPGKDTGHGRICFICEYDGFIIATSHFSGEPVAQAASAEMILDEFKDADKPVIFCGDLNAEPDSSTIAKLKEGFRVVSDSSLNTCHSLHPSECLDYIFIDKAHADHVKCSGFTVGTSTASDHFPIWIDIEIK